MLILNSFDFQWNNSDFDKSHLNTNGKHCYSRDIFYVVKCILTSTAQLYNGIHQQLGNFKHCIFIVEKSLLWRVKPRVGCLNIFKATVQLY